MGCDLRSERRSGTAPPHSAKNPEACGCHVGGCPFLGNMLCGAFDTKIRRSCLTAARLPTFTQVGVAIGTSKEDEEEGLGAMTG